eukprot:scaffold30486_cov63-Phaeocystis_antarctica.AAC.2
MAPQKLARLRITRGDAQRPRSVHVPSERSRDAAPREHHADGSSKPRVVDVVAQLDVRISARVGLPKVVDAARRHHALAWPALELADAMAAALLHELLPLGCVGTRSTTTSAGKPEARSTQVSQQQRLQRHGIQPEHERQRVRVIVRHLVGSRKLGRAPDGKGVRGGIRQLRCRLVEAAPQRASIQAIDELGFFRIPGVNEDVAAAARQVRVDDLRVVRSGGQLDERTARQRWPLREERLRG